MACDSVRSCHLRLLEEKLSLASHPQRALQRVFRHELAFLHVWTSGNEPAVRPTTQSLQRKPMATKAHLERLHKYCAAAENGCGETAI
jgi:hypothetical protein